MREAGASTGALARILLADPDATRRGRTRRKLEARFDVCGETADAPATLATAIRRLPDLCLVEASLPGGALDVTREITSRLPGTRVVIRAETLDHHELREAIRAGSSGYLIAGQSDGRLAATFACVLDGEAAIPRVAVASLLDDLRDHARRRRSTVLGGTSSPLTSREWQVFDLLCQGSSTAEIAERLMVSQATVRSHVASIVRKLGVQDRAAAIDLCGRLG